MDKKQCKKCLQEKPLSAFNKHPKTKDKLGTYCKDCHKQINSEIYKRDKEKIIKRVVENQKRKKATDFSNHQGLRLQDNGK